MWLPKAERRGEIHFYFAKSLPYNWRLVASFFLMASGLLMQVVLVNFLNYAGIAVVLAGVLLLLTKGFENTADVKGKLEPWRPTTRDDVLRIISLNKKQKKWDQDAVDITCVRGVFVLVGVGALVALAFVALQLFWPTGSGDAARILVVNAFVMFWPFWVTGVRSILKNDRLIVKINTLLGAEDAFNKAGKQNGEEFQYQMQTAESKKDAGYVPRDVKAILMFHDGPREFLGLQMQVSINSVQGTDYPYFYCVLVARHEFGGLDLEKIEPPPSNIVIEPSSEQDVDIVVIRQKTTKNSGYHTPTRTTIQIFNHALKAARCLVARRQ